jgi:lysozyme
MYSTYNQYIKDHFEDYEIWIRDIYKQPDLEGREWLIWQYNNRGRVKGIDTYVDINAMKQPATLLQRESSPYR